MRAGGDRLHQFVGEQQVEHRGLVDHHQIGVERAVLVVRRVAARFQLQQAVHRRGVGAGELGEPLGGPPGGRGEHHLGLLGPRELDHRAHGEGLAAAGAAGEHRDLAGQREPHGVLLLGGELGAGASGEPGQGPVPVHVPEARHPVLAGAQQPDHLGGEGELGAVEGDQIDGGDPLGPALGPRDRLADDALLGDQLAQAVDHQARVDLEELHRVGDELLLGQEAVALVGGLGQGVLKPRLHSLRAVVRDADGLGDAVGGEEADAPDVGGQPVGLVLHHGDRGVLVLLVDAHGDGGGDADALEEDHHFLDGLLLLPGGSDELGALGAEAGHLHEAPRLLLDDVERVRAEVLHDAVGDAGADALDQARAEVAPDALDSGGQDRRVVLHGELLAVLRVRAPAALHPQRLARLRAEQRADHREEIATAAPGVDPGDRVAVLLVGVRDPLQDPFDHREIGHDPTLPVG